MSKWLAPVFASVTRAASSGPGDTWSIPGNVPHEVQVGPEGAVVIDVFVPTRDDWREAERVDERDPPLAVASSYTGTRLERGFASAARKRHHPLR